MQRRCLLTLLSGLALERRAAAADAPAGTSPAGSVQLADAQWKQRLTARQYEVLRKEGTEASFSSALNDEHRKGTYVCVGCELPLFSSDAKFDSGTGWPSFSSALPGAVQTKTDYFLLFPRTEYHCARCGGHHGHVFNDGPRPTGKRYCNNGVVLRFVSAI